MPMDKGVTEAGLAAAEQPAATVDAGADHLSRRKALGRMVAYTAPAMLALLTSKAHADCMTCG